MGHEPWLCAGPNVGDAFVIPIAIAGRSGHLFAPIKDKAAAAREGLNNAETDFILKQASYVVRLPEQAKPHPVVLNPTEHLAILQGAATSMACVLPNCNRITVLAELECKKPGEFNLVGRISEPAPDDAMQRHPGCALRIVGRNDPVTILSRQPAYPSVSRFEPVEARVGDRLILSCGDYFSEDVPKKLKTGTVSIRPFRLFDLKQLDEEQDAKDAKK